MECKIITLKNIDYLQINGSKNYKISAKTTSGRDCVYRYYAVKIPIGRDPCTHKVKCHDVLGKDYLALIDNVLSLAELSDAEMQLTNTDLTIRDVSKDWFVLRSIDRCARSQISSGNTLANLLSDPIADRTPISLTEKDIIEWQKRILRKYSAASAYAQWICLHMIIKYSIDHRYAFFDPMPHAMIFKYTPEHGIALSRIQIWELLYNFRSSKYFILFAVILLTGMRISEALGLSWNDIDFQNRCIHIHQQCQKNAKTGRLEIYPYTKTRRSRTIYPPECFFWCLNKQKKIQQMLSKNPDYENCFNLVFTNSDGSAISHMSASVAFEKALKGTGLIPPTLHDLRTTCATYGARLSGDMDATQHYLGHKDKRTVFDYIYSDEKDQSEMIRAIDKYFSKNFQCGCNPS